MCQINTLPPKAKSRRTAHTRNILAQLRKRGRVYVRTADYGMIRVTKVEARLLVRGGGDDFTAEYLSGELVLKTRV